MDTKQPEALRLAPCPFCGGGARRTTVGTNAWFGTGCDGDQSCPAHLRALTHKTQAEADAAWNRRTPPAAAELLRLRTGYNAARLEIESLQTRIQELGQQARECSDRKVVQLESALAMRVRSGKDWAMRVEALERTITTLRAHIASSNAQAAAAKKAMREPEAQVAAVGAGGMEPLRKTNSVEFDGIKTYHGQLLRAALQEAEAALEVALARILKRDPGHAVNVTSEAKALVIVRSALAESQTNHFRGATEMVQADAPVVLPEPVAYYDGERWYANEESAICACADMPKLQKVYTEQQVRAMLATGGQAQAVPNGWREQFATEVYADLEAADNQDVPLEEYPARILKVLDSTVGPRHPVVIKWRNDAIEQCIAIARKYCRDPESHKYLKQDLEAMLTAEPAPQAQKGCNP